MHRIRTLRSHTKHGPALLFNAAGEKAEGLFVFDTRHLDDGYDHIFGAAE
jgi:hypothetical protein